MNDQDFLDGYRCGLGAAIRTVDLVAELVPGDTKSILLGIISALRTISASVTLAEEPSDG